MSKSNDWLVFTNFLYNFIMNKSAGFSRLQLGAAEYVGTCKGGGTNGEFGITAADGFVGRR